MLAKINPIPKYTKTRIKISFDKQHIIALARIALNHAAAQGEAAAYTEDIPNGCSVYAGNDFETGHCITQNEPLTLEWDEYDHTTIQKAF